MSSSPPPTTSPSSCGTSPQARARRRSYDTRACELCYVLRFVFVFVFFLSWFFFSFAWLLLYCLRADS
jgi:hypothetical protein